MGDRSNIVIQETTYGTRTGGRVWLYGHWMGERALTVVQSVIESGERLTDESYLARIVFEAMVPDDQRGDTTGYGISTRITDNEYPIIVLDPDKGTAWIEDEKGTKQTKVVPMPEFASAVSTAGRDYDAVILLLK